jgi:hypothetical protein
MRFRKQLDMIRVEDIAPNPRNPREKPSRKEVSDIRSSLESVGEILVPLVVYRNPLKGSKEKKFILLDGERRWRAAKELAEKDPNFARVPANIISQPLSDYQNLRTMFNIHMKRREWSTAAVAEALDDLFRTKPSLRKAPVKVVSYETGLGVTEVREAKLFLRMPKEDRARALSGDLDEYYLILLSRNLSAIQNGFPELVTEGNWLSISKTFIKKVDDGWISDSRSFNLLGKASRACIARQKPELFSEIFAEILQIPTMTPDDAWERVEDELLIGSEKEFVKHTKEFLRLLEGYLRRNDYKITRETREILDRIVSEVGKSQS